MNSQTLVILLNLLDKIYVDVEMRAEWKIKLFYFKCSKCTDQLLCAYSEFVLNEQYSRLIIFMCVEGTIVLNAITEQTIIVVRLLLAGYCNCINENVAFIATDLCSR